MHNELEPSQKMSIISGQPSKFAVLAVDSSSDSEEEWTEVKGGPKTKVPVKGKVEGSGSGGNKQLSKNAKKRARKKKSQQTEGDASAETSKASSIPVREQTQHVLELEKEFEKELAEALVLSRLEDEAKEKLDREKRAALAAATSRKQKGVTLTLQEFLEVEDLTKARWKEPQPEAPAPDPHFFERLEKEVMRELKKEKQQAEIEAAPESARVAQLTNELEKRDSLIKKLQVENESLVRQLKEVKERNQSLYKILSQGEFSNTAELLQQIEQLNTVKQELTTEVDTLNSNLEQERSKNKQLRAELVKLQGKGGVH
ncbi:hypothetical protein EMCRGX_G021479 [Ephydatia muelleri]